MNIIELFPGWEPKSVSDRRALHTVTIRSLVNQKLGLIELWLEGQYPFEVLRELADATEQMPGVEFASAVGAVNVRVYLLGSRPRAADYLRVLDRVEQACYADPVRHALERVHRTAVQVCVERDPLPFSCRALLWWRGVKERWVLGGKRPEDFRLS